MQPSDSLDILHAFQCNAVDIKYLHQYKYDIFLLHGPIRIGGRIPDLSSFKGGKTKRVNMWSA